MRYSILRIAAVAGYLAYIPLTFAQVENLSLAPPVTLTDGTEFKTWENNTKYKKTYFVDQSHSLASDSNPGTAERPFLTINQAAQVVRAGGRVLIREGVYREKVVPRYGGEGPNRMISYEAAPGEQVVIKGSCVLVSTWVRSMNPAQFSEKLWMTNLPDSIFPEISPFKLQNASAADIEIMPWAQEWVGRVPYTLSRGLVFQDGQRLAQLAAYEDLVRLPGSYWVDSTGSILHIHPYEGQDPNQAIMEVTVQQHLFKPDVTDLGYIQVKGITFMHAGNGFPRTGTGALFTMGGHHWLIENNRFMEINSVAVEIGAKSLESSDRKLSRQDWQRTMRSPGYTIVRDNVISECGTGGIQGYVHKHTLVENNHLYNIGWQDVERYWECGAIKLLAAEHTLVRRNLIHDVEAGSAIWLDWDIKNSRITQNTVYDLTMCCNGALFIEAAQVPNMIDHNIVWSIHGVPIYTGDTDSLLITHNLVGSSTGPAILSKVGTDRSLHGRPLTSRHNRITRNTFYITEPMEIEDPDNSSNHNLFTSDVDLDSWQAKGFDTESRSFEFKAVLDRDRRELIIEYPGLLPMYLNEPHLGHDFYNKQRENQTPAGPFIDQMSGLCIYNVDPRESSSHK